MFKRREYRSEWTLVLLLFILINLFSLIYQQPISLNNGRGWDGVQYFKVAEQLASHSLPNAKAPFVYRIGTPLLAAIFFKNNLLLGFKIVNIAGNILATVLLVFWFRLYLNDWKVRTLLTALFLFMWHGPIRFVYYYPVYTDSWLFVALIGGLIGIRKIQENFSIVRIYCLTLVVFIGTLFRETTLIIPVAFLFSTNPVVLSKEIFSALAIFQVKRVIKSVPGIFFLPLGVGGLGFLIALLLASQNNSYSFVKTAVSWAYGKPFLTYLHAWFIGFGPIIVILIYYWREGIYFLVKNQFALIYMLGIAVLAWIGGSDTERILFWNAPIVYLLIGMFIEDNSALLKSIPLQITLLISQLLSERVFWTLPDYPNKFLTPLPVLTILNNKFQYLDLYSYHGSRIIQFIAFLQYLVLGILLLWWLNYRKYRVKGLSSPVNATIAVSR